MIEPYKKHCLNILKRMINIEDFELTDEEILEMFGEICTEIILTTAELLELEKYIDELYE